MKKCKVGSLTVKIDEVFGTYELKISKKDKLLVEKTYYELEDLHNELNVRILQANNKVKQQILQTRRKNLTLNVFKKDMVVKHTTKTNVVFYKIVKKVDNYFVFDRLEYIDNNTWGKVEAPCAHRVMVTNGKLFANGKTSIMK